MPSRTFAVAGGICFIAGAIWALYAVLPLLLVVGAVGAASALPSSPGHAALFIVGAFRIAVPQVQPIADINNYLLPLWLIVLGGAMIRFANRT